jgi:hypothetical protein
MSSPSPDAVQELRFDRDMLATRFLDEVERLIAPLRGLDEHQRTSIVALAAAAQLITVYERSQTRPSAPVCDRFDRLVAAIHEDGSRLSAGLRKACVGTASEAEELDCVMMQLEAMHGALQRVRMPFPRTSPGPATTT